MTTAVAGIILSERLGFDVELVDGATPREVYKRISAGEIHLAFESWPKSNPNAFRNFTGENASQPVRWTPYSKLFGRSGIFETCSRSADSDFSKCSDKSMSSSPSMLKDVLDKPEGQQFFSRKLESGIAFPRWVPDHCEQPNAKMNCTAQILHVSTEYDKGLIEGLVTQLRLPATVVYVGTANLSAEIWAAYTMKAGTLVYNYSPNTNHHGISALSLPRAKIRPAIDLAPQQLIKLAWPGLADIRGGDALSFWESFDLDERDYAHLAASYDRLNDPHEAACAWIHDNEVKWLKWVKFPERKHASLMCFGKTKGNGLCDGHFLKGWILLIVQVFACLASMYLSAYVNKPPPKSTDFRDVLDRRLQTPSTQLETGPKHNWFYTWMLGYAGTYTTRIEFLDTLGNVPKVLTHVRTYENFLRSNLDPKIQLPPAGGNDRWISDLNRRTLFTYLLWSTCDSVVPVVLFCFGLGFFSSALSTVFYQLVRWETFKTDPEAWALDNPTRLEGSLLATVESTGSRVSMLIAAYVFFPTFLQMGYVVYAVGRWRSFQEAGFTVIGKLNNLALLVGSAVKDRNNEASMQLCYRVYRYLATAHMLLYKTVQNQGWFGALTLQDLVENGLLTQQETLELSTPSIAMHEVVITWISDEMYSGVQQGLLCETLRSTLPAEIRGWMGAVSASALVNQPVLWSALMLLVCDLLVLLFVLGNPLASFMYEVGPFQSYVFFFTVLQTVPYLCVHMLVKTLENPYQGSHDMFDTAALVAWSERSTFNFLRSKLSRRLKSQV